MVDRGMQLLNFHSTMEAELEYRTKQRGECITFGGRRKPGCCC